MRRDIRYRAHFAERLGALPFPYERTAAGAIWLHAVSVGEVLSAVTLIRQLRAVYPLAPIFVSCTTVAGRELAENKMRGLIDGLFYAPLDYVRFVRRVLRKLRPSLVVVLETEIWPNLYREVKRSGAQLVIVNGRISDRALPRYRRLKWFFRAALAQPDLILVQSEQDRPRYIEAGATPERIRVGGNLKYDFSPAAGEIAPAIASFLKATAPGCIWIAASTMPGADSGDLDEDDVVIDAFQRLARPDLLLILVPRRPERFAQAAAKLDRAGVRHKLRSELTSTSKLALPGILVLDTIGELSSLFAVADLVFMGGTLARRGGHNIVEPAYFGKCVIVGPHMENFAEIAAEFQAAGATVAIPSADRLAPAVQELLDDPGRRTEVGNRARVLAEAKRGVAARIAEELLQFYDRALPRSQGLALLQPLAAAWAAGVQRDRRRGTEQRRTLSTPVIGIGNITMGGSGKTPFVAWLAEQLAARGETPAVLTRGYRRRSVERTLVLRAGTHCPVSRTGDEAQILLRAGVAHIGIGADRYETGAMVERELHPSVFLLDDGFQHWRLHRELDIVLVDALEPFGGGEVFPRGRLREPLEGLARAHAFVITRTEPGLRTAAIERVLRRHNPDAPIFRSQVTPRMWRERRGESSTSAPPGPVAAFCGLGNPRSFWRTLECMGIEVAFRWSFGDHHRYRPVELRRLAARAWEAGAVALVTTEKDFLNLPEDIATPIPLWWLQIGIEVENADALLELVRRRAVTELGH